MCQNSPPPPLITTKFRERLNVKLCASGNRSNLDPHRVITKYVEQFTYYLSDALKYLYKSELGERPEPQTVATLYNVQIGLLPKDFAINGLIPTAKNIRILNG